MIDVDTIVAVATPPGQGGIGVVRLSGPRAHELAQRICGKALQPRNATLTSFRDSEGEPLDEGIALYFKAPASFTGEDVIELQAHGAPIVLDALVRAAVQLGARIARPGEFSERAYLNGRMDLAQAEAIADLIASGSEAAARAAQRGLQGRFSEAVERLLDDLEGLRIPIEATIDFPEEEEDFLARYDVPKRLAALVADVDRVRGEAGQGARLAMGAEVAILGQPNAGKSSLMNALSGEETAIVTDIPGTTRDLLRFDLAVNGLPVRLIDTAGLRDAPDVVEQAGVARARAQVESADVLLVLLDLVEGDLADQERRVLELAGIAPDDPRLLIVANKLDVAVATDVHLAISARLGTGLDLLKDRICERVGYNVAEEPPFLARTRHLDALDHARQHLEEAAAHQDLELVAEALRQAHNALGEITGKTTPDEFLGKIFSTFCIGK